MDVVKISRWRVENSWSDEIGKKGFFVMNDSWFGTVFVIAAAYHIYLNWTALKNYFKTKVGEGIGLRTEWVIALLICLAVYVGTVRTLWPFSSLIEWKETYHDGVSGSQAEHGSHYPSKLSNLTDCYLPTVNRACSALATK